MKALTSTLIAWMTILVISTKIAQGSVRRKRQLPDAFKDLFAPKSPVPGVDAAGFNALSPLLYGQTPEAPPGFGLGKSPVNYGPPVDTSNLPDIAWLNPDTVAAAARPQVPVCPTDPAELTRILQSEARASQAGYTSLQPSQKLDVSSRQTSYSEDQILALLLQSSDAGYPPNQISCIARQKGIIFTKEDVENYLLIGRARQESGSSETSKASIQRRKAETRLQELAAQAKTTPSALLARLKGAKDDGFTYGQMAAFANTNGVDMKPTDPPLVLTLLDNTGLEDTGPLSTLASNQAPTPEPVRSLKCPPGSLNPLRIVQITKGTNLSYQELSKFMKDAHAQGTTHEIIASNAATNNINLTPEEVACIVGDRQGQPTNIDAKLDQISAQTGISKETIIATAKKLKAAGNTPEQIADVAAKNGFTITPNEVRELLGEPVVHEVLLPVPNPADAGVGNFKDPMDKLLNITKALDLTPRRYVDYLIGERYKGRSQLNIANAARTHGINLSPQDVDDFIRVVEDPNYFNGKPTPRATPRPATRAPQPQTAPTPVQSTNQGPVPRPPAKHCNEYYRGPFESPQFPEKFFVNACDQVIPMSQVIGENGGIPNQIPPTATPPPQSQTPSPVQVTQAPLKKLTPEADAKLKKIEADTGFSRQKIIGTVKLLSDAGNSPEEISELAKGQGIDVTADDIREVLSLSDQPQPAPAPAPTTAQAAPTVPPPKPAAVDSLDPALKQKISSISKETGLSESALKALLLQAHRSGRSHSEILEAAKTNGITSLTEEDIANLINSNN